LRFGLSSASDVCRRFRYIIGRTTKGEDYVFGGERHTKGNALFENLGLLLGRNVASALPCHDFAWAFAERARHRAYAAEKVED